MNFLEWFDTFMSEKGLDKKLGTTWELKHQNGECHIISLEVVVDGIRNTTSGEQQRIKSMLVKIDFVNGDVMGYFKHLARALVLQW